MMTAESRLDPESLVARIIDELRANPEARTALQRALFTDEFLGMPKRLERVEADIVELKADVRQLKVDVGQLKVDVGHLKGDSLETKLARRIRPLLGQRLGLRRARVMQGLLHEPPPEIVDAVECALNEGIIDDVQETRIDATDLIVRAQRKADGEWVWVAVEVPNVIGQRDIQRVRDSTDALSAVFKEEALAVVVGYRIREPDRQRAVDANVHVALVGEHD